MPPGPAAAALLIANVIRPDSPPRKTTDLLLEIILFESWFLGSVAQDKTDQWADRFIKRVELIISDARSSGSYLTFGFNSSGTDYIQGSCFVEPADPVEIKIGKIRRSKTLAIADCCRKLTSGQVEQLCGNILHLLHVEKAFVSRRSADQGIDFFGRVPYGEILKPSFLDAGAEKHIAVWVVGQAKHYPDTAIATGDIRQLVGSVELARAKVFVGNIDPLSDLTVRLCDPVIYLFVTTGRFSRDSLHLLSRSGVLAFDGLQIGQFLADHGVGIVGDAFDPVAFDNWLAS